MGLPITSTPNLAILSAKSIRRINPDKIHTYITVHDGAEYRSQHPCPGSGETEAGRGGSSGAVDFFAPILLLMSIIGHE
jgi:hypothetical protein